MRVSDYDDSPPSSGKLLESSGEWVRGPVTLVIVCLLVLAGCAAPAGGPTALPSTTSVWKSASTVVAQEGRGAVTQVVESSLPLPECWTLPVVTPSAERVAELEQLDRRLAPELLDRPFVTGYGRENIWGVISVTLSRRQSSTNDWLASIGADELLCVDVPPEDWAEAAIRSLDWSFVDESAADDPDLASFRVSLGECAVPTNLVVQGPIVEYRPDEILLTVSARAPYGQLAHLACVQPPTTVLVTLTESRNGRPILAASTR